MLIVGAKGFAKEVLEIVSIDLKIKDKDIVFFDDVSLDLPDTLFGKFQILRSLDQVEQYFTTINKKFVLGLGSPLLRAKLLEKLIDLGGHPVTLMSNNSTVGHFGTQIGIGSSIMSGAQISNSCTLGKGNLIYFNTVVSHDCTLGDFVEVSPSATILGRCKIGSFTSIGAGATILPDVEIGSHVTVGAGAVVLNNIPNHTTVVGVPAKIIKTNI